MSIEKSLVFPIAELTPEEAGLVAAAAGNPAMCVGEVDFSALGVKTFASVVRTLPSGVLEEIAALRSVDHPGAVVIRGLPLEETVPPTPTGQHAPAEELLPCTVRLMLAIARIIGQPYTYADEYDGAYVTNVMPTVEKADIASSRGGAPLRLHTETVHLFPMTPAYVALFCVREDPAHEAKTVLASARDVERSLAPGTIEILRNSSFSVAAPNSFGDNKAIGEPVTILSGPVEAPEIRLELNDMRSPTSEDEREALRSLAESLWANSCDVDLRAGDMLVIDNRKVVHGRTPFSASFDGTDRWLLRVLVTADFWPWRSATKRPYAVVGGENR